eukprot:FR739161.1.p1 GENE.FR739161.1~~FR739161.1.p1  ORF type:complete len:133 (+),score=7.85 FR739161.1:28-399(+)
MANGRPLFAGTSEADQLNRMFQALGTPDESVYPGISELPEYRQDFDKFPPPPDGISLLVPSLRHNPQAIQLISQMLVYDPAGRISAHDGMHHPYFSAIHAGQAAAEQHTASAASAAAEDSKMN